MRILYGVQATGQGHISRARALAEAFEHHPEVDVTWLFSGRARDKLFDMEPFGNFQHRRGLTFVTEAGRLRYRKTAFSNNLFRFFQDVRRLQLDAYDLIVTDYEPVTAWAARWRQRPIIGIGHQYAFGPNTPKEGNSILQQLVMERFAPVDRPVGLHWAAFGDNVLPPILDLPSIEDVVPSDHVMVYLPFEDQDRVTAWLQRFPSHSFRQYASGIDDGEHNNVLRRRANISGFKHDLARCRGVICNSGFELISECLQWRKPVLTRPLAGQMEQLSNGAALEHLGYATVMRHIDDPLTTRWLTNPPPPPPLQFPDVAARLAEWLAGGATEAVDTLCRSLWN